MSLVFEPERGFVKGKKGKGEYQVFGAFVLGCPHARRRAQKDLFLNRGPTPPPFPRKRIFEIPSTPKPKRKGVASSRFPPRNGGGGISLCGLIKGFYFPLPLGGGKICMNERKGKPECAQHHFHYRFFYRTEWSGVQRFVSPLPS